MSGPVDFSFLVRYRMATLFDTDDNFDIKFFCLPGASALALGPALVTPDTAFLGFPACSTALLDTYVGIRVVSMSKGVTPWLGVSCLSSGLLPSLCVLGSPCGQSYSSYPAEAPSP